MSNRENRAFNKFKYLEGKKPKAIHEEMQKTLGPLCPSYGMVKSG
jgi:hypothetical protein